MTQVDAPTRKRRPEPAAPEAPAIVAGPQTTVARRSRWRLPLLLIAPVLAVAIAGWLYFTGGRYVSEENSYVGAPTVTIVPQVSGEAVQLNVHQNQQVSNGASLFVIDPEPYRNAVDGARAQVDIVRDQIAGQIQSYRALKQQADQAQANLTYAQQQLDRVQQLVQRGPRPRHNWMQPRAIGTSPQRRSLRRRRRHEPPWRRSGGW